MSVVDSLKFLLPSLHRMVVSSPLDVMLNLLLFSDTERPGSAQAHTHLHIIIKFVQTHNTIKLSILNAHQASSQALLQPGGGLEEKAGQCSRDY